MAITGLASTVAVTRRLRSDASSGSSVAGSVAGSVAVCKSGSAWCRGSAAV
jgi:hypothetical protein